MRDLFVAPRVPADDGNPKHFDVRRLDHHEKGLQVAPAGASAVLVDNHFASRLRPCEGTRDPQCDRKAEFVMFLHFRGDRVMSATHRLWNFAAFRSNWTFAN